MSSGSIDIHKFLNQCGKNLTWLNISNIIYNMCKAIDICHYYDILHGDIKPQNFIITKDFQIKLIDFGISICYFSYQENELNNMVHTLQYRAPEVLLGYKNYTKSVDIWALGCTIFEVINSKTDGHGIKRLFQLHNDDNNNDSIRQTYKQLMVIMECILYVYPNVYNDKLLRTYPLWENYENEIIKNNITLKGIYIPLQLESIEKPFNTILKSCLYINPKYRPSASKLSIITLNILNQFSSSSSSNTTT